MKDINGVLIEVGQKVVYTKRRVDGRLEVGVVIKLNPKTIKVYKNNKPKHACSPVNIKTDQIMVLL